MVHLWVMERCHLFRGCVNSRYLGNLAVQISGWTNALPDMVISHLFGKVMFKRFLWCIQPSVFPSWGWEGSGSFQLNNKRETVR